MKRLLYLLVPAILFLSFISTSMASPGGVELKDYAGNTLVREAAVDKGASRLVREIIYLPETAFDYREAAGIITRIGGLPEPLLRRIRDAGITIKLFEGKLTDNPTARNLKGTIPRGYTNGTKWDDVPGIGGSRVILVKIGSSEKGKGHGSINLELHELAHSADSLVYGHISDGETFRKLWQKECPVLFPRQNYFLSYPEEYYAEVFALYYYSNETNAMLKNKAPLTYEFLKGLE